MEDRYLPKNEEGMSIARKVYGKMKEECEMMLTLLIETMKKDSVEVPMRK